MDGYPDDAIPGWRHNDTPNGDDRCQQENLPYPKLKWSVHRPILPGLPCGEEACPPATPDQPGMAPLPTALRREMLVGMAKPIAKLVPVITPRRRTSEAIIPPGTWPNLDEMAPFWRSTMRPTRKYSVCLVTISVSCVALLVFCNSVWSKETETANPRIKELRQNRLAVLEKIHDVAKQSFANARISYEEVLAAKRELITARLEYADTQQDRIKTCDEAVQEALELQQVVQAMVEASRASGLAKLKAQAYLLETQIMREKAETVE